VALYAVVAVAFGNQNTLSEPVPYWNPLDWNVGYVLSVLENVWDRGQFLTVFVRTFVFVALALALSLLIGYPVAYFAARHAGRWKAVVLLLLILPFWINYLMRMLAWINLLSPDGLGTRMLRVLGIEDLFMSLGLLSTQGGWLEGQPSTVILASSTAISRSDPAALPCSTASASGRSGGAISASRSTFHASPALSRRRARERRADRAPDVRRLRNLVSRRPRRPDRQPDRPAHPAGLREGRGRGADDAARRRPAPADALLPPRHAQRRREAGSVNWLRNPWGRPRFLVLVTAVYILWSLIPVALAVLFAFNDGRSRTTWQGFSLRWFTGESGSVLHEPALQGALRHTVFLGLLCVLVATPLGVALALGLQRWRGRGSGTVNTLMLLPLVTPEIVMGVSLLLLFLQIFPGLGLGTSAQAIGQVTFTRPTSS
jgi:ABC-type spermidine/putrescine transport system permease subunit II